MKPIIRWAGSKRRLIPQIRQYIPAEIDRYIEPFCGSACIFFECINSKNSTLADINPELINAYRQLRKSPRKIHAACTELDELPDTYYMMRALEPSSLDKQAQAVRFLYLNRYGFNGVYRTNRTGKYNVPRGSRTGKFPDVEAFVQASKQLKGTTLKCSDFEDVVSDAGRGDFLYIDPPYSTRGTRSLGEYGPGSFDDSDLCRLIAGLESAHNNGAKFVLSFKEDKFLRKSITKMCSTTTLSVQRSVAGFATKRASAQELLAWNF